MTMWIAKCENQGLAAIAELFRNKAKGFVGRALTGPVNYEQIPDLVDRGAKRIQQFFDRLERQLKGNQYIAGETFSCADIAAVVAADFAKWSKIGLGDDRPQLNRWYTEVAKRPSMQH